MEYWTIKEASKKLGVEAHVLRYWEEELGLVIKRNDMGHRYYDSRNMEMFDKIQKLKEQGFTLKDIRAAIEKYHQEMNPGDGVVVPNREMSKGAPNRPKMAPGDGVEGSKYAEKMNPQPRPQELTREGNRQEPTRNPDCQETDQEPIQEPTPEALTSQVVEFKTAQLQSIMNRVVANALRENKDIIKESVKGEVVKDVLHQLDLVMRENEEREDERFRKLDESLRRLQQANEEVAATRMKKHRWRRG